MPGDQQDSKIVLKTSSSHSLIAATTTGTSPVVNCATSETVAQSKSPERTVPAVSSAGSSSSTGSVETDSTVASQAEQPTTNIASTVVCSSSRSSQPESSDGPQHKTSTASKGISILKPLYDREADLEEDTLEGFQKTPMPDISRHGLVNKVKTVRDSTGTTQSAFTVASILNEAKRANQVFVPQKSALPLIVNKDGHTEQPTQPVVTVPQKATV